MTLASRYIGPACLYIHSGQEINIFYLHMDIVTLVIRFLVHGCRYFDTVYLISERLLQCTSIAKTSLFIMKIS